MISLVSFATREAALDVLAEAGLSRIDRLAGRVFDTSCVDLFPIWPRLLDEDGHWGDDTTQPARWTANIGRTLTEDEAVALVVYIAETPAHPRRTFGPEAA